MSDRRGAFPVVIVPSGVAKHLEVLGTKAKFWFQSAEDRHSRPDRLFKRGRPNEDWSEKVAAELADLLQLPHAAYDLAVHDGQYGVVTSSFVRSGEQLVHGNELLYRRDRTYARDAVRGAYDYTVERVIAALGDIPSEAAPDGRAASLFVGYLLLDAWIGNTDRHHENWGLLESPAGVQLAPTYDHATCLGRELTPERANRRLTTRDRRQTVEAYLDRARSAFYAADSAPGSKPVSPLEAWRQAAALRPEAARHWRDRLAAVPREAAVGCIARVPSRHISDSHRALATRILEVNRQRIDDV